MKKTKKMKIPCYKPFHIWAPTAPGKDYRAPHFRGCANTNRASTVKRKEQPRTLQTKNLTAKRASASSSGSVGLERYRPRPRRTGRQIGPVEGEEYSALSMLRLNSQVQQYGGFTPGRRFSERTPNNADRHGIQSIL